MATYYLWSAVPSICGDTAMKQWLLILICISWSWVDLSGQAFVQQPVSVQIQQQPLADALWQLIEKEGIPLSFQHELLPKGAFTFRIIQQPCGKVLDQLLQNTLLSWKVVGEQIIIVPRTENLLQSWVVSGYVTDAETGERLIGANIIDLYSNRGTVSNEYGFFSLSLPEGNVYLRTSYLGYVNYESYLPLNASISLKVALQRSITLSEIIVYPRDSLADPIGGPGPGIMLGKREAMLLPTLAGEPDILRLAHLLPGVTTGADGAEGLQVRGGDAGQNLVLLDGVPVYYVNHAIGLFSVFNGNAVSSARLLRGAFPARYGGRLSSVLDIRMKDGNTQQLTGHAEAGLLSTRALLEGPVVKGRSSFLVAGRWSFVHTFLNPQSARFKRQRGREGETNYRFFDFNAKYNHNISPRDHLFLSLYHGQDRYDDLTTDRSLLNIEDLNGNLFRFTYDQSYGEGLVWGNTVGSLRWNHLFSDKLFANFNLTYSELDQESWYNTEEILTESSINFSDSLLLQGLFRSGIQDMGAKADWQWNVRSNLYFRYGAGFHARTFRPGALLVSEPFDSESAFSNNTISTREGFCYLEGQGVWQERWSWNAGIHLTNWQVRGQSDWALQPRASIDYLASEKLTLNASAGRMVQYLHFLRNTTLNLPTEIWVPSTQLIPPATSWQQTLGGRYEWGTAWQVSVDAYYKAMQQLLAFREGVEGFANWEENVVSGQGVAYGAELQVSRLQGPLTGWLSYTLSRSQRQFDELNLGRVFPFRFDRRHNLQLAGIWQITPHWHLSANWTYASGFALTLPLVKFTAVVPGELPPPGGFPVTLDPVAKNNIRMPAYHRLDLNIHVEWKSRRTLQHALNLGIYNVYNRNNPLYYDVRRFLVNQNNVLATRYQFVEVQLAPILPILSYQFGF
ncbi:MAG: TonB-dependent receptor [Saprospiraceae bacterium]